MKFNAGQMFTNRAWLSPEMDACCGENYSYNYRQANQRLNRFASFLQANNIGQGDRIAVLCKNNEHATAALFGAAKIGVVTVLLNWRLTAPELDYILNDCAADLLLYDAEFSETVEKIKGAIPARIFLAARGEASDMAFEAALEQSSASEPAIIGGGSDPALLMYTSGTTGKPKGAMLSHDNVFWASLGLTHSLRWALHDRYLLVAPLFHIGGLAPILANVHVGCTTYYMPDFHPGKVWETVVREKINFMMTVPLMLGAMMMIPGLDKMDLGSLRHIICGGSPVPQNLILAYHKLGIKVYQVYGATEYTGAITFWTHDMDLNKSDSMGKPVFHGDVKVLQPGAATEMPPGQVGELCLFGPQVFSGYWGNPRATREVLTDGYYRSGDLGRKDEQGYVYVMDRLKDMIISGSENIYPAELEAVIQGLPGVAEVAVAGRPDEKWGEVPVAFVVRKGENTVGENDVINICRQSLAGYKCVKEVMFVEALPKNATGKIMKKTLREQLR